jgi:hypothetical protein
MATSAIDLLALAAPAFFVPAGQFIARQIVIERIFVKTNHVEFPAVVVAMAFGAFLSPHLRRSVKPFVAVYPGFDLFVAIQALIVRDLASQIVALGTF